MDDNRTDGTLWRSGVSIAVIYDGKIEWTKTYGVMDKEDKTHVTKESLFQAGSISKPVTKLPTAHYDCLLNTDIAHCP